MGVSGMTNMDLRLGDCLEVMKTLPDGSVDLIFTDPPYGHNNNNNGDLISRWEQALGKQKEEGERRPILNDGAEANDLLRSCLPEFKRILVKGGTLCCCCGGGGPDPQFARWSLWIDEVLDFKQMIVWDKGPMGMGWHYRRSYETILVAHKPGGKVKWHDDSHKIENIIRPGAHGIKKIIPSRDQHPTPKPVALPELFIKLHSLPGETVFDPFMGGGSTGVACKNLDRNFIGIELDPQYFEIAKARIENTQGRLV